MLDGDALFHLHVDGIKRKSVRVVDGVEVEVQRSIVAAAAYRAGDRIWNEPEQKWSNFSAKEDVALDGIITPDDAPAWMADRQRLWNHIEAREKRYDAQLAKEIEFALPVEIPEHFWQATVTAYALHVSQQYGVIVDYAVHRSIDDENPHVHLLLTTRELTGEGFGNKIRELDRKAFYYWCRKLWEKIGNTALKEAGSSKRLHAASYKARGIKREPTRHRGSNAQERNTKRQKHRSKEHIVKEKQSKESQVREPAPDSEIEQPHWDSWKQDEADREKIDAFIHEERDYSPPPPWWEKLTPADRREYDEWSEGSTRHIPDPEPERDER